MALACAMGLGLTACGQGDNKQGETNQGEVQSVAAAAGNQTTQEKLDLYTEAFNALVHDHWGVPNYSADYQELDIPNADPTGSINFPKNISHLERALAQLKEGKALSGGAQGQKADAAVEKLIPQLEALLTQWRALAPYYESRAYREDALAKGKAAHPALLAAYQGATQGIDELDAALTEYQRAANAAKMAELTKAGHAAEASLIDAMQKADHFTTAVIEDKTAEADRLLPELEAAATKLRETAAGLAADAPNKPQFNLITGYLDSMIGSWRDYKQNGADYERESIVDSYNSAISQMNSVKMPI